MQTFHVKASDDTEKRREKKANKKRPGISTQPPGAKNIYSHTNLKTQLHTFTHRKNKYKKKKRKPCECVKECNVIC